MTKRWLAVVGATGLAASVSIGMVTAPAATAAPRDRAVLAGSLVPAKERAHRLGTVAKGTPMSFQVALALRSPSGARAELRAVSDPSSPLYRHFLTDAQWTARYGPKEKYVAATATWLRREGFTVGRAAKDRMFLPVTGTAGKVERAFATGLAYYEVAGRRVILATRPLTLPSHLARDVATVVGVDQTLAVPTLDTGLLSRMPGTSERAKPRQEPPPPGAFVNAKPCGSYWGAVSDTKDSPKLYAPFKSPLPYDICGYTPAQMRSAYGLSAAETGKGTTIAIVDTYDSPTLFSDSQRYFKLNDPSIPLEASQFTNIEPSAVDDVNECGGGGWYGEQTLDVQAAHTMAPDAHLIFVGTRDCSDSSLAAGINTAITSGANVVTDSWGDDVGDIFAASSMPAFDDVFLLAGGTGVTVLFSSGDLGDNFAAFGLDAPDYPASSPYVTSVGGTAIEIGKSADMMAEYGWSTGFSILCTTKATTNCGSSTKPQLGLGYADGGGGGTSFVYTQPWYQAGIVPTALAERNADWNGPVPYRVEPDIAMDADPATGFLQGMTEAFPDGKDAYGQFKDGGTSLASPLLAGVMADTVQAAGTSLGFVNPLLYSAYARQPSTFRDVLAPSKPDSAALIWVFYNNNVNAAKGYQVTLDTLNYEGPETYCDATGNCATRPVTLTDTAKGYNSMTGLGTISPGFISALAKY